MDASLKVQNILSCVCDFVHFSRAVFVHPVRIPLKVIPGGALPKYAICMEGNMARMCFTAS